MCLEIGKKNLHGLDRRKLRKLAAQEGDALEFLRVIEQFLAPGGGIEDMDRGENPLLGKAAVEVQLHVAGALELLEDDLVHAALGLDEGGGR